MYNDRVTIFDSWKLSNKKEIVVELQHFLNGLMPGTILRSIDSGLSWKVVSRTIFPQAKGQIRFKGEREIFEHYKFMDPILENHKKFRANIAENESKGVYQYSIEPMGHEEKPKKDDVLLVE